jgi:hypothetical protein
LTVVEGRDFEDRTHGQAGLRHVRADHAEGCPRARHLDFEIFQELRDVHLVVPRGEQHARAGLPAGDVERGALAVGPALHRLVHEVFLNRRADPLPGEASLAHRDQGTGLEIAVDHAGRNFLGNDGVDIIELNRH